MATCCAPSGRAEVKRISLSRQIIGTVIVCQLLLTATLTIASVVYARIELLQAFDSELSGRAASILALVRYTETRPPDLLFDPSLLPPSLGRKNEDMFEIRKTNGQLVAQSNKVLPEEMQNAGADPQDFELNGVPYRRATLHNVVVLDDEDELSGPRLRVTVTYASSLSRLHKHLTELGFYVGGTSLFLLALASGLAAWAVRRRLEPLRALAESASTISPSNWNF